MPADVLQQVGIILRRRRSFATATKQIINRDVGYAILSAEGYETTDEVVFAEPSDMTLLGVRTLEGFGVVVDNIAHRFVAQTTIVAWTRAHSIGMEGLVTSMGVEALPRLLAISPASVRRYASAAPGTPDGAGAGPSVNSRCADGDIDVGGRRRGAPGP